MNTEIPAIDEFDRLPSNSNALYADKCKQILAESPVLARILKSCVPEFEYLDIDEIQEKWIDPNNIVISQNETQIGETEIESVSNSNILVKQDIVFDCRLPVSKDVVRISLNIEDQNKIKPDYPLVTNAIYHSCYLISSLNEYEFVHPNFNSIKKIYNIWISTSSTAQYQNSITSYSLKPTDVFGDVQTTTSNELFKCVVICLGDDYEKVENDTLKLLNVLFSSKLTASEKKSVLKNQFNLNISEKFEKEINEMSNLGVGIREKGINHDIGKGIEIGEKNGTVKNIVCIMQNTGSSIENVMSMMSIPESEYGYYCKRVDEYLHNFKDNLKN